MYIYISKTAKSIYRRSTARQLLKCRVKKDFSIPSALALYCPDRVLVTRIEAKVIFAANMIKSKSFQESMNLNVNYHCIEEIDGVIVIINTPLVWPSSGTMIPSGSLVNIAIDSYSGYATQRVLNLDNQPCKYDTTGTYSQETCLLLCKRSYVIKYCGCNPSFLFPASTILLIYRTDATLTTTTSLTFHYTFQPPVTATALSEILPA